MDACILDSTCFATLSEDIHRCNIVHMPFHNVDWHLNSYFNVTDEEKVDKYLFFFNLFKGGREDEI